MHPSMTTTTRPYPGTRLPQSSALLRPGPTGDGRDTASRLAAGPTGYSTAGARLRSRWHSCLALAALLCLAAAVQPVAAATLVVTSTADSGPGSLRQALADAASGDTIDLTGVTGTITLTSDSLHLTTDLTLTGPGTDRLTISGNQQHTVFWVHLVTATIEHLTISQGRGSFAGGIFNQGTLTINHCTLADNSDEGLDLGGLAGGIYNQGPLTVNYSTLTGNSAPVAGGILNNFNGPLTVNYSTLTGNSASQVGGIWNIFGPLTVNYSTLAHNAGGDFGGGIRNSGFLTLTRTLVAGNTANSGPEIFHDPQFGGAVTADHYNLFGHDGTAGVTGFTPGLTDVVPLEPLSAILAPTLANNGGPTLTLTLGPDSPARDAIPPAACALPATDQRGVPRPQGPACDIGALEADVVAATTLCATLGDDAPPSLLDQDVFRFAGTSGETVTLTLSELLAADNTGERATLLLLDEIPRVLFVRINSGALPNTITATLPATGHYRLTVAEQPQWAPGAPFRGDYCVTLESSGDAWQTLATTDWVEALID